MMQKREEKKTSGSSCYFDFYTTPPRFEHSLGIINAISSLPDLSKSFFFFFPPFHFLWLETAPF